MQIRYRSRKLERLCTIAVEARREYGLDIAEKLQQRVSEIEAADSLNMLVQGSIGRCHPLHGDRQGQYSMDLTHPHRLVIEKYNDRVDIICIMQIEDYH